MDRISGLPDELLVKILLLIPTKVAVCTSILSKRWKFLWMWLPKLEYVSNTHDTPHALGVFIHKNLPLHRAPVIESLRLMLTSDPHIKPEDIKLWVEIAVSRYVRELDITYDLNARRNMFPSSLFNCISLVILKLINVCLMEVPAMVCLPSLKTLQLKNVIFADEESFQELLSICPILHDLDLEFCSDGHMKKFNIIVPSLQKLSLIVPDHDFFNGYDYVIDTPSLKYFKIVDMCDMDHDTLFKNMPMLKEAYADVLNIDFKGFIRSITSVKHLTLCSMAFIHGTDRYDFNQLEHMNLCVCNSSSANLIAQFLKGSPKLRVLDISILEDHYYNDRRGYNVSWNQPSDVPECLLSSLQIFKWSPYYGTREDRDIVVYILKNARHLKTATIISDSCEYHISNLNMIKELALSPRASTTCQLVFVEDGWGLSKHL